MSDKKDEDGLVYSGNRTVRKGGKIKVDNAWYEHEDLKRFIGQTVFIYNSGSYWGTEYTVYPYWAAYRKDYIICIVKRTLKMNQDKKTVQRYYSNINEYCELSKTAYRAFMAKFTVFDFEAKGYGYIKISGYQYRIKL